MRILVQSCLDAKLEINNNVFSSIERGYLLLVSFKPGDNELIIDKMIAKLLKMRIFLDEFGKSNLSIKDIDGEIMSVSQFTLYGSLKDGNRPSFTNSLKFDEANKLYKLFNNKLEAAFEKNIATGQFGADMKIHFTNDGPYTIMLDSMELWGL